MCNNSPIEAYNPENGWRLADYRYLTGMGDGNTSYQVERRNGKVEGLV